MYTMYKNKRSNTYKDSSFEFNPTKVGNFRKKFEMCCLEICFYHLWMSRKIIGMTIKFHVTNRNCLIDK